MQTFDKNFRNLEKQLTSLRARAQAAEHEGQQIDGELPSVLRSRLGRALGCIPLFRDSEEETTRIQNLRARRQELTTQEETLRQQISSLETQVCLEFRSFYPGLKSGTTDLERFLSYHEEARSRVYGPGEQNLHRAIRERDERTRIEEQRNAARAQIKQEVTRMAETVTQRRGGGVTEDVGHVMFGGTRLRKRTRA